MFRTFVALSLVIAFAATSAQAQVNRGDRWTRIASKSVDLRDGQTSVDLSGAKGSFKAFRLRVAKGAIKFSQLQFMYIDGGVHQIDKEFRLRRRERTKILDLRDEERFISSVEVSFEARKKSGRYGRFARLEVWGLQSRKGRVAKRPADVDVTQTANAADGRYVSGDDAPPLPPRLSGGSTTPEGDVLFGAHYVGFDVDRDVITVGSKVGKFGKIRLRVRDNDIFITTVRVFYEDGEPDVVKIYSEVLADAQTDWLDLKGDRFIKEVRLSYRARPGFEGQARVELFGLHSNGWLGTDGEGRKFNDGWVLLGAQPAGFIGFDRDVIPVGLNKGGFREVKVAVRERAITLNQLKVFYEDGQEDIIPVRARVNAGSTFGPVALRDASNGIKKIEARYRSRFIDRTAAGKGNAIVEVWAKH